MIYSVNFLDMTEKINPLAFVQYLSHTGWMLYPTQREYIRFFQYECGDIFFQIVLPMEKTLADYKQAMYKAVETVAEKENRSIEQVMLYLLNPNTDILKIRMERTEMETGSILFDDAIRLYDNTKKLLAAAALDVIHPKIYHQGRLDDTIVKFLSECRFGQTEIGSYVVSVVCPFAELNNRNEYRQLSIFSEEEQCAQSLTRRVTQKVMKNISVIKNKIDAGAMQELVEFKDDDMISANFYEALNGLNLESENVGIEFAADWSPTVKNHENIQNHIMLTHDYYQPIAAAAGKLKDTMKQTSKIVGRIKKLESSPIAEKRTRGCVSIVYLDAENKPRTVLVQLDKLDYDKAIRAHADGNFVEVSGELTLGKRSSMKYTSFNIIE